MPFEKEFRDEILDSLGEGLFTVNKDFRINFFNKAAEKITGFKKEEVVGKFCKNIFRSELCFSECPIAQVLRHSKNIYDHESKIITKKGAKKPIKLNAAVLYNELEEPAGGVISFRDLSELEEIRVNLRQSVLFNGMIGQSKKMREIFDLLEEISESDASVFIHGESGTGKELVANAVQSTSLRKNNPFIKINCAVFPQQLLASELFGHVKGAFTDAVKDRPGRFEVADKGTLFLDEVAEMPLQMQLQLLRVLQEGTFERVGESVTRKVDVRVIAATNIDIDKALEEGSFREDLFYRLNVIPIEVPPLRERPEDIIPLVKHMLGKFSILYKKNIEEIEEDAVDMLLNYKWPGNVRELENVIEYAFVRTLDSAILTRNKLPQKIKENEEFKPLYSPVGKDLLPEGKELFEVLERNHWNKTRAALELGIGRTTLWRKMKKYGLEE